MGVKTGCDRLFSKKSHSVGTGRDLSLRFPEEYPDKMQVVHNVQYTNVVISTAGGDLML